MKQWMSETFRALFGIAVCCGGLTSPAYSAEAAYKVLKTAEHDASRFTQGLIVDGDNLIESAGRYGESKVVRYNTATGHVLQTLSLPSFVFAEGIHQFNDSLYLLTWRENCAYRLNAADFSFQQSFKLENEGWGLTHDGQHFIQSDGSDVLFFRNSTTFKIEKKLPVREGTLRRNNLNELEYAKGLIWANIFMTSTILAISPDDGQVAFSLDLSELSAEHVDDNSNHVLNGIAYDAPRDAFWVTGKCWDKRYLITIDTP